MMNVIIIYLAVSVVVGFTSIARAINITRYMNSVCSGDVSFYEEANQAIGYLNLVFFPSLIIYAIAALVSKIIK